MSRRRVVSRRRVDVEMGLRDGVSQQWILQSPVPPIRNEGTKFNIVLSFPMTCWAAKAHLQTLPFSIHQNINPLSNTLPHSDSVSERHSIDQYSYLKRSSMICCLKHSVLWSCICHYLHRNRDRGSKGIVAEGIVRRWAKPEKNIRISESATAEIEN